MSYISGFHSKQSLAAHILDRFNRERRVRQNPIHVITDEE